MPRVPESELQRLKEEISVERLVGDSGIELKCAGKDLLGRCPFHADDTASLVVTPGKSLWHCFGCDAGGGPIDWVMKTRSVSFRHAVELLREGLASSLAVEGGKRTTVRSLPGAGRVRCRRCTAARAGGRVLPRDVKERSGLGCDPGLRAAW